MKKVITLPKFLAMKIHTFFKIGCVLYLLCCMCVSTVVAQIKDDFSDGNLGSSPVWQGDTVNFIVNADKKLQLNAPGSTASSIVTQGNIPDEGAWSFSFKLDFAPSTQNLLRVYLLADGANLSIANGYFIEIGESGAVDAIQLFRQRGSTRTKLAAGTPGLAGTAPVELSLQIRRSAGVWNIESSPGGQQISVRDTTFSGGCNRFFGIQCVNTTTNSNKFFFDDINIVALAPDVTAPVLRSTVANSPTTLTVQFNEILDSLSAVNPGNYSINKGVGSPNKAVLLADKSSVELTLNTPLGNGDYTLQSNRIADCLGNVGTAQSANFSFFQFAQPEEFDVLINEIFPDVSPSVGLPATEWVELYNRSQKIINLSSLFFSDASGAPRQLPDYTLRPDSFVVLCATGGAVSLRNFTPNVLPVPGFPSLNDAADAPALSNASGQIIDRVTFDATWHLETAKRNGGWSLERIDPGKPCIGADNWQSCPVVPGGTPGRANVSLARSADTNRPQLVYAYPLNATTIRLIFSEGMDKNATTSTAGYSISPARAIASVTPGINRAVVLLTLSEPLQPSVVYAISPANTIFDCAGNAASSADTIFLGLPEQPAPLDIVINEVMCNPATGGSRYFEVYNRSRKIFSWEHFFIANYYDDPDIVEIGKQRLLLPGQYDVFTENPGDLQGRFSNILPEHIILQDLPSLDDKKGNITLYWVKDGKAITVDSVLYDEEWHNALFNTTQRNGVALERISTEEPTNIAANWTSAAPNKTGAPGTPTLPNSQSLQGSGGSADGLIFLPVERLSPDDDGFEDFLEIQYRLPAPDYAATITIFDSGGIVVRRLGRQTLTGIDGFLRWDGETNEGTRARPGIYVLFAEFFNPDGTVQRTQKAFAVTGRL
jgi:hypothetical protein